MLEEVRAHAVLAAAPPPLPPCLLPRPSLPPTTAPALARLRLHATAAEAQATLGLMDALNLTRPHVAGWSLGACAALKLAAHHPDRIGKVSWLCVAR